MTKHKSWVQQKPSNSDANSNGSEKKSEPPLSGPPRWLFVGAMIGFGALLVLLVNSKGAALALATVAAAVGGGLQLDFWASRARKAEPGDTNGSGPGE